MSRFTARSKVLVALTVFTCLIAIVFQGHLLVYTSVLLTVSTITLFIWSVFSTRGLSVLRYHPEACLKGQSIYVTLVVVNNTRSPRFLMFGFDYFPAEQKGQQYKAVAFHSVGAKSSASIRYEATCARRGVFEIGPFYFYSGDPMGFFRHVRAVRVFTKLAVMPVPLPVRITYLRSRSALPKEEYSTIALPGESTEFLGVREYQLGDPLRKIHWLSTARTSRLVTKQFEENVSAALSVLLINNQYSTISGVEDHNPLEYSVTIVSSLGNEVCRHGSQFSFLELNGNKGIECSGSGEEFFYRLSLGLAAIKGGSSFDPSKYYESVSRALPHGSDLVVLLPLLSEKEARFLASLSSHYRTLSVISFDLESFRRTLRRKRSIPRLSYGRGFIALELGFGDDIALHLQQFLERVGLIS